MEIKELRIGNLVKWGIHECLIKGIHTDTVTGKDPYVYGSVMIGAMPIYTIEGIELTPEWLTRLGWVWNPECNSWEKYPNGDARMHLKFHDVNASYTMFNYVLRATIAERIYYVHQLMNLYFSLTGEELAIDKTSLKNETQS